MNSPQQNEDYFNSFEYKEWLRMAKERMERKEMGYWVCKVTSNGDVQWFWKPV